MKSPIPKTVFPENPYRDESFERDYFHSPDGIGEYPQHHCKLTFHISLPFVRSFRRAVDVGCRDGEYARYLQHYFQHTYCSDPRARKRFCYNVDLAKVTHFCCALGDEAGVIRMTGGTHRNVPANPLGRLVARIAGRRGGGRVWDAPCCTLDEFELEDVDYIKIDVEGFERKVLQGAEKTIATFRPTIVIEQNDVTLPGEEPFGAKTWQVDRGYRHVATCPRGFITLPPHAGA